MKRQPAGQAPLIVRFQLDLRLADHPALHAALAAGGAVIPVFIWAPGEEEPWAPGAASRWWLHHSLQSLDTQLRALGSRLVIRTGPTWPALRRLLAETNARGVYWNRRDEPAARTSEARLEKSLCSAGFEAQSFHNSTLFNPESIRNRSGRPFQVFTPFWRHCLAMAEPSAPLPAPRRLRAPASWPSSEPLPRLSLLPARNWAVEFDSVWHPGEPGAATRLKLFLAHGLAEYASRRDRPDLEGTSCLSPHLHFGEISPRQVWLAANQASPARHSRFASELAWREFAHYLLFHFPHSADQPLRREFEAFPWRRDAGWLRAWQRGRTGYPFVDAGLRQLWRIGWMHNRVRMAAASFLVKDLLISWREGARWFWDTLVDADLAQNTLGWQWSAGCGADAAPFFRIFNPTGQGEKFDPDGSYVRRWLPELAPLPNPWVHRPNAAPAEVLARARRVRGQPYPKPLVSHAIAREVALEAFRKLKEERTRTPSVR